LRSHHIARMRHLATDDSLRERSVSAAAAVRVQARAAGTNQPAWLSANLAGTGPPARPPLWLHAGAPAAWLLLRAARRASHVCRMLYRARCTSSVASLQGSYGCATALCSHRSATRRVKSRDSRSARLAAARHAKRSTVATVGQRRQRAADNVQRTPCRIRRVTFRRLHAALFATMGQHSRQHAACNGRHGNNRQRSDDSRSLLKRNAASAPRRTQRLVGSEPADQEWVRPGLCMGIKRTLSCIARQVLARPEQRWAQSRCRCGADVAGARPSRGADVGRVSPVPAQTWQG
jgi:hypothetical protein